jgi:hypothetical protein
LKEIEIKAITFVIILTNFGTRNSFFRKSNNESLKIKSARETEKGIFFGAKFNFRLYCLEFFAKFIFIGKVGVSKLTEGETKWVACGM